MQQSSEDLNTGGEEFVIQPPPTRIPSAAEERKKAEEQGFKLFMGNLGLEIDEAFLTRVFSKYGSFVPASAIIRRDKDGRTLQYGYVAFSKHEDVVAAYDQFKDGYMGSSGRVRLSWSPDYTGTWKNLTQAQLQERIEARRRESRAAVPW
ncbi:RNA-binding protein 42 [Brachypodium distachyon]|uniref:RRM domain-containing protein n=1 Tax=Brachypodium distachyon TaxID=15368 RepID=A0A2K2DRJ2_BRADI|nr:RNA-binding protein 42 [Brachypodium distachyon]PNT76896.1 hypothetical protein BRADI_1g55411v3 [Brachypodium distachyon]|eukprot:XP_014752115.1 RNA-binding protein 42 [Brachypodium distachyon]